jgi:DNA-binding transcriptional MerR regulator
LKISELSTRSGVSIPTLKFYLREGLLPGGRLSSPNQAEYGEEHLRRAALIRALRDVAGLSIAKIRTIVDALNHGEAVYEVMGVAVDSLGGETIEEFTSAQLEAAAEIDHFLGVLGLPARPESLARHQLIAAWATIKEMLFPQMPVEMLTPYASAAMQISDMENMATEGMFELSPDVAIEKAVLGLALFEPILAGFRRLAHEQKAHERAGLAPARPAPTEFPTAPHASADGFKVEVQIPTQAN